MQLAPLLLAATGLLAAPAAAVIPPTYAVVIGIDDYQSATKLQGAVNDARLIAATLRAEGAAEVVTLIDSQVTRTGLEDAVRAMGAKAAASGGWLVVTYAGHGSQEPERIEGDEDDQLDEILVLPGFGTVGASSAQRLPDNELRALLAGVPSSVNILLVVDACHSGTMTRSPDPRSVGITYRSETYGPIVDDQLPPPPADTKGKEATDLPNLLFIASALDSEKTPELEIEGAKHGALSWYFAKALKGGADADKDGKTTFAELRQFLVVAPRALAQGRQTPGVSFFPGRESESFPLAPQRAAAPSQATGGSVTLWALGGPPVAGIASTASAAQADLVWDPAKGEVVDNRISDMIAQLPAGADPARFLAGVVDKQHALRALYGLVAGNPLALEIRPRGSGARYAKEKVTIEVQPTPSGGLRYLTVFNIAGDGTVQTLFPGSPAEAGEQPEGEVRSFSNNVTPPYGADHVVAVTSERDPADLRAILASLNGQQAASQAIAAVAGVQRGQRAAVGVVGLFTGLE